MDRRQLIKTGTGSLIALATANLFPAAATAICSFQTTNTPLAVRSFRTTNTLFVVSQTLRLCCNENPYGPSPVARQAIKDNIINGKLYPRAIQNELKAAIAKANGLTPEHVLLGAGSASILQLAGLWMGQQQKEIISADYTFDWLMRYAKNLGSQYTKVPLTEDLYFDLEAMKTRISPDTGLIYLCNPNNPTGTYLPAKKVHAFCREVSPQVPVFVDEAYIEYIKGYKQQNTAELIKSYPNVLVCRTFSKIYGMAGLRIGYLLAYPAIIQQLEKLEIGMGMAISYTSLAAATASLKDKAFLQSSLEKNNTTRRYLQKRLAGWGIDYHDASANFVHCDVSSYSEGLKEELEQQNIMLYPIQEQGKTYLRITIGTQQEMEAFAHRMDHFFTKNN